MLLPIILFTKISMKIKMKTQHYNACKKIWQSNKPLRNKIKTYTKLQ